MGSRHPNSLQSKADQTARISKSVFVSNFPDGCTSKDLWKVCNDYGTVVDVYIPSKKSKVGKRFAFVRFIKVNNMDRLIANLNTIWMGSYHLFANPVRFERPSKSNLTSHNNVTAAQSGPNVNVVKGSSPAAVKGIWNSPFSSSPAMVLDDSCVVLHNFDSYVMGEVKQFSSIGNLRVLLAAEGFVNVKPSYLGGLWVLMELDSISSKTKLMKHVGVASWFSHFCDAQLDFVSKDRIVWVDIEGVPLNAWSRATFNKVCARWGDVMDLEESNDGMFARKRIYIKTKLEDNILEKFKIIIRGKVFVVRAKELFVWSPVFKDVEEMMYSSEDESEKGDGMEVKNDGAKCRHDNSDVESDVDGVSDTVFGVQEDDLVFGKDKPVNDKEQPRNDKEFSSDPFNIYNLLNKKNLDVNKSGSEFSLSHPQVSLLRKTIILQRIRGWTSYGFLNGRLFERYGVYHWFTRRFRWSPMNCLSLNIQGLGSEAKKTWIRELNIKHKVSFLSIQETKSDAISDMEVKRLWGNSIFDHTASEAVGNSGGILCVWDPNMFRKSHHIISDNFVALFGSWIPNKLDILFISVYAPQSQVEKRILWNYIVSLLSRWNGEYMVLGDFNEVRSESERMGSLFNAQGAKEFNNFILNAGLVDIQLEGYSYTWAHPSASKMSKLDRFLVSEGLISLFPAMSAICLDRHLSDHRPILLHDVIADYGAIPFRLYHSWFTWEGFDQLVSKVWKSTVLSDRNGMVRFIKKLQILKKEIRSWAAATKSNHSVMATDIKAKLKAIDITLDQGGVSDDVLLSRMDLMKQLQDIKSSDVRDQLQKAKVQWAIEGDENSKFFHGIINRKRANLAIKGVMVDGDWVDDPPRVKAEFLAHFSSRFQDPGVNHSRINFSFPTRIKPDQATELEKPLSPEEIRVAVWACGADKSPGPDGFSFEFFRKFWSLIGPDMCIAVEWFFSHCAFTRGCNSSFISLIPKVPDPKFVSDYRPISLIGSLYKVVTKILALRLSLVISDLISDVQTAFLPNRQILDGPFILNELLSWCKFKKQQTLVFKVDFAKAYDSIRWDYLDDVLAAFGFGSKWRSWIKGSLSNGMASILVNGSPTAEFQFFRGLKQGDPLAPYLFILVMESFHLSISRAIEAGFFTGIKVDRSLTLSHLFYADDAVFIGEWSTDNLRNIMQMLHCFSLSSGMVINLKKSQLLGIGVHCATISNAASSIGCAVLKPPFKYLGVMVGGNMSRVNAWEDSIGKIKARLSKWKLKTLSVGGRLTLLKSVLGSTPIYSMSLYKVPKTVLNEMESLRRNFFNGVNGVDRKIAWVQWAKVLASRKYGGLGVSSFFALNRALLFKWCGDSSLKKILFGFISFLLYMGSLLGSFRRLVRGGVESQQIEHLRVLLESVILSSADDRWVWELNGEGIFNVKDARQFLDDFFLPKAPVATRWIKSIPIKVNIFAWKLHLDRLPTRVNLARRGVQVLSSSCPVCNTVQEDVPHLFFLCDVARDVSRLICRWWNVSWSPVGSYLNWLSWFNSIRLGSNVKDLLEGVFYIAWMRVYVVVSLMNGNSIVEKKTHSTHGPNPKWNHRIKFPVEEKAINTTTLLFVLKQHRIFGAKDIGEVSIPVHELLETNPGSGTTEHVVDYQVQSVRGKSKGTFTFSHQFKEKLLPNRDGTGTSGSNHPPGPTYMINQQGMTGYPYHSPQGYVNYPGAPQYGGAWYPSTTPPGGYAYPPQHVGYNHQVHQQPKSSD
ncbi:RNA-directed DNA polymerase, eukaryota [Tanacetum coccineum]